MTKLEDYLLPPNLIKRRDEFIQEIDAIIDGGGISGQSLSLDEIMELESRNYSNAGYDEISKDEIEEERLMSELGFKDWVQSIEDEEHYIDHEELPGQEKIVSSLIQKSSEITDSEKGSFIEIPDYLLNDPEIVGYPDEDTQMEIYDWVHQKIFDLEYHKFNQVLEFSVKDLGCGRGDFYSIFKNSNYQIDYFGIDSNPNLIQVGLQKYTGIKLICNDFNDVSIQTDYTICIGTLNDDHGLDKWDYFNKTLNHALNNTKTAIIFVLQADCYGNEGHLDYGVGRLVSELGSNIRWEIDNSKFEDIYLLTVHFGGYE